MLARPEKADLVAAVTLTVIVVLEGVLGLTSRPAGWVATCLAPMTTLPVAWRARWTRPALLVVLGAMALQAGVGSDLPGGFAEPIALVLIVYSLGSRLDLRAGLLAAGGALVGVMCVVALGGDRDPGSYVFAALLIVASWFAGRVVRLAGERAVLLADHRAQLERSRIARELHDVVAHNVSALVVQAAARRRDLAPDDPTNALLGTIERQGRETLQELRRLLGLLVMDEEPVPRRPQPGLADVPGLVAQVRDQGIAVAFTSTGSAPPVGDGLQLAIYRVVQEALTNVRKHAREPRASVRLAWRDDDVEVEITSGPQAAGRRFPGSGFGLRSMAQRVEAYGGRLAVGKTPDGFRVHAVLPVGPSS